MKSEGTSDRFPTGSRPVPGNWLDQCVYRFPAILRMEWEPIGTDTEPTSQPTLGGGPSMRSGPAPSGCEPEPAERVRMPRLGCQ